MVSRVPAYKSNDGRLFATEAEAARVDAEMAIKSCMEAAGLAVDDILVQAMLDNASIVASALASYVGAQPISWAAAQDSDECALHRRLKEGEDQPGAWHASVRAVPIRVTLGDGV